MSAISRRYERTKGRVVFGGLCGLCVFAVLALMPLSLAFAEEEAWDAGRRAVAEEHPRLLGTRAELRALARERPQAYERVKAIAGGGEGPRHQRMISLGLVSAIEEDAELAREAIGLAMELVEGGVRRGHVPFGHDLALGGLVFDLCHEHWTADERRAYIDYYNATVEANEDYGRSVFHNGWWGYKHWGVGVGAYATYHENERAAEFLAALERDYAERAAPALQLAGAGGSWAEGYYIHYFLYDWLMFCEIARRVEGVDYYALAPEFYGQRALASVFEMYPGLSTYNSRRPIPRGDGGGRTFGGDRDKALSARRILVNYFRDDAVHHAVQTYNEATPRSAVGVNAYKDLLWREEAVPAAPLEALPLSHVSEGAGHVYARSGWGEDATYFFFKMSDRFTSHQQLDAGHFLIYRHAELAGKGGHYDGFGSEHDVNYHLRSIAHNTVLVHDPAETWPNIRAGEVRGNDGGQHHDWPHHNGAVDDPRQWHADRELYDIVDLLAFEDAGDWLYVAGDATRAYAAEKVEHFTRQVVYIRPGTFVIFDRVRATEAAFEKSWVLQAMREPVERGSQQVITHGEGRLFVQTLLPERVNVEVHSGDDLYRYDGGHFPPGRDTGPAPEARVHVSPVEPARAHLFLHVLRATDAEVERVDDAEVTLGDDEAVVEVEGVRVGFRTGDEGGWIEMDGRRRALGGR